jgi:hypothetical protein
MTMNIQLFDVPWYEMVLINLISTSMQLHSFFKLFTFFRFNPRKNVEKKPVHFNSIKLFA